MRSCRNSYDKCSILIITLEKACTNAGIRGHPPPIIKNTCTYASLFNNAAFLIDCSSNPLQRRWARTPLFDAGGGERYTSRYDCIFGKFKTLILFIAWLTASAARCCSCTTSRRLYNRGLIRGRASAFLCCNLAIDARSGIHHIE